MATRQNLRLTAKGLTGFYGTENRFWRLGIALPHELVRRYRTVTLQMGLR
jgi:hypothetical protein